MTALYISPHLDDVALSCAGGLLRRIAAGCNVVVCTVFCRDRHNPRAAARRCREDASALSDVGVQWIHLDFADAPDREGFARSFDALALAPEVSPVLVDNLKAVLRALIASLNPQEVWFPLGVGQHIDHRTVFCTRDVAGTRAHFYEDRPYAFVNALRTLRFLEIGGGQLFSGLGPEAVARELATGPCRALFAGDEVMTCAAAIAARLRDYHTGLGVQLHVRECVYEASELVTAANLISAYRSQVQWLWGSRSVHAIWQTHANVPEGAPGGRWYEREIRLAPLTPSNT